jgi:mono/diheme cytochrome c family protein
LARLGTLCVALVSVGCTESAPKNPLAERGRQVYLAQCTQCHASDPGQTGPVGPSVKGASRELLEAKILRGGYPPAYRPQRSTSIMPPQPAVAAEIPALAEYLKN